MPQRAHAPGVYERSASVFLILAALLWFAGDHLRPAQWGIAFLSQRPSQAVRPRNLATSRTLIVVLSLLNASQGHVGRYRQIVERDLSFPDQASPICFDWETPRGAVGRDIT